MVVWLGWGLGGYFACLAAPANIRLWINRRRRAMTMRSKS
jgi:hypothetical protein